MKCSKNTLIKDIAIMRMPTTIPWQLVITMWYLQNYYFYLSLTDIYYQIYRLYFLIFKVYI